MVSLDRIHAETNNNLLNIKHHHHLDRSGVNLNLLHKLKTYAILTWFQIQSAEFDTLSNPYSESRYQDIDSSWHQISGPPYMTNGEPLNNA